MKSIKGLPNLASFFQHDKIYYMKVCRVKSKGKYSNNGTGFILEGITEGLFFVVLEDKGGGKTHTIGINRGLNIIYDCMETHELNLTHGNPSKCCGPNRESVKFFYTAELKNN